MPTTSPVLRGGVLLVIDHGHTHDHAAMDHEHAHTHGDGHHDHVHEVMPGIAQPLSRCCATAWRQMRRTAPGCVI